MPLPALLSVSRPGLAAFAAMGVLWGTFAAALPDIKAQLGVAEGELGLLLLATPMAAVAAMLLAPAISGGLGRVALPVSCLVMAAAFVLPGQVSVAALFPLAMICCGIGTGLTDVLMNARVAEIENRRGLHLMNLCHAAYSFGYAGGALATGAMRAAGWGPAWVLGTMAAVAAGLALASAERDGRIFGLRRPKGAGATGLGLVPLIGGGIVLIAFLTENAAESWSALHIEKTLGGSPAEGAMGPAVLALTMGIARLGGQGLASRIAPAALLTGGAVVSACGALTAAAAVSPAMAYAGFIVMGIGSSVIAPTAFSLTGRLAAPEARARAVARATLLGYFGYFIGPPGVGFVAGLFGLRAAFVAAAIMLGAVLVLAPLMARVSERQVVRA
ncbi:MAG: MFS transporter [Paracoccaceae bacterium]